MTSPTQPMMSDTVRNEISQFVAAVEKALGDLPADDVAELTDGLEADLTEAWAAEGTTPAQRFGSPAAYAADLRAAAGIPLRRAPLPGLSDTWRRDVAALQARLRRSPGGTALLGWAQELQPAWWVIRAPAVLFLVASVLFDPAADALLVPLGLLSLPLIVLSLRWRSAGGAEGRRRIVLRGWNLVAVTGLLLAPFVLGSSPRYADEGSWTGEESRPQGLFSGDDPVTNVFAYDAQGRPLTRVQLFDQNGRALVVAPEYRESQADDLTWIRTTPDSGDGPAQWNLFPLAVQTKTDDQMMMNEPYGPFAPATPPYKEVPALPQSTLPAPGATSSPGATPTSSTTPTPGPSSTSSAGALRVSPGTS